MNILSEGLTWTHQDILLKGLSLAGISTSVVFPSADVCFDVAQGLPFQIPINNILITHGHLDHAAGLPYLIGQKAMRGSKPPRIFVPDALLEPMREIMRRWSEIENHQYDYDLQSTTGLESIPLKGPYFARVFPTFHRVPSQGYTIFKRGKRLKDEYRGQDHRQLGTLRRQGILIEEPTEEAVLSFSGDTRIEFLDHPYVRQSRILVMEATYWDDRKTIENAREWGHIHLDELISWLPRLGCEKIVLIHTSVRYPVELLRGLLDQKIPKADRDRVEIFPRP